MADSRLSRSTSHFRLSAVASSWNQPLKLGAQVGFLDKAVLPAMNGPEFILGGDLQVFGFQIAETHHAAKQSVSGRAVVRIETIDTSLDESPLRQLRLN